MASSKNKINYVLNWLAFLGGLKVLFTGIIRFSNVLTFIVINTGLLDTTEVYFELNKDFLFLQQPSSP